MSSYFTKEILDKIRNTIFNVSFDNLQIEVLKISETKCLKKYLEKSVNRPPKIFCCNVLKKLRVNTELISDVIPGENRGKCIQ